MSNTATYHIPVLLNESIEYLNIQPNGVYVDATFGGGGHSRAILNHLSENGKLFAFDQDKDAQKNLINDQRLTFIPYNFSFITQWLHYYKVYKVNGILADLGVSLHQFQTPERGFSYRYNHPLDMRMNQNQTMTAADVVNTYSQQQLENLFYQYGDLKNAHKLASLIIKYRFNKKIETTFDLVDAVKPALPKVNDYPLLSKIFQSIRIEVNKEVDHLKSFLNQTYELLDTNGRLVVITYHSLEDRIVKHFMTNGHTDKNLEPDPVYGKIQYPFKIITKKPIQPSDDEIKNNPSSRSAKLRVAEKI
ncbi:MAG TPA: 16S rRNA (cytosine(1402)-N(4))-methyltransferase RsmH [Bacteroidia bacterium]|nr:16S rRNA (cytosine(1402)-N(4))-methyltransferase RsmH [Bacteroidia bacterium]